MRRSTLCAFPAFLVIAGLAGTAPTARAQQRPDVIRGVVRAGGVRIPYAVVELSVRNGKQFTDDSGAFRFGGVPPGAYRLYVRQVGFRPFDSTVVKAPGSPVAIEIDLEPLVVELAAISVSVPRSCAAPGPPDSAIAPEMAVVFDQLRQNAERYALLADSYPFHYRMSRVFSDYDERGRVVFTSTDTVQYLSSGRMAYRPGQVLAFGVGPEHETAKVIRLPTLADFADSVFQASHCFFYAGIVQRDTGSYIRFDYLPSDSIRFPDIAGEVDLDVHTYQIRYVVIRLTRVSRAMPGLVSTSSTITFGELYPNVFLPVRMEGVLVPEPRFDVRTPIARSTETQQLLDVHFQRPLPGMAPSGP